MTPICLHDLPREAARWWPDRPALTLAEHSWTYAELEARTEAWTRAWLAAGLGCGERVAVYLDKQLDGVAAALAICRAGGVLVPINPLLKSAQVAHILQDCGAWGLLTQGSRWAGLAPEMPGLTSLACCVALDLSDGGAQAQALTSASDFLQRGGLAEVVAQPLTLETDLAAIFYTSGSTGLPKGVMLSHRNLMAGAASVVAYLGNTSQDVLLAVLPLSFDAGFSQLTTGFSVGAHVVLLNYLMPMDVIKAMQRHRVTGITAVPPLYAQLTALTWPEGAAATLRYWANTGGRMPRVVLEGMQARVPRALPYLMYGLTEAFRSTYLPPAEVHRRPDSIGRAIPNADVLVVRPDGSLCDADEPGELVHRGPLVAMGYWNRPEATADRFKLWRRPLGAHGPVMEERAVYSGDRVRRDAEGFLYFVGREDEMIKTSGYRVSPTELEEVALSSRWVREVVAWGVDHEALGQVIMLAVVPAPDAPAPTERTEALLRHFRQCVPAYMVPSGVIWVDGGLPRTPNGKLDRQHWRTHVRV